MNYSQKALAVLQQADQLDHPASVISPRTWAVSGAVALTMLGLLAWGIFGDVPERASASGVLTLAGGMQRQDALTGGQVDALLVEPGATVHVGDELLRLSGADGRSETVRSKISGRVTAVLAEPGHVVAPGAPLLEVTPVSSDGRHFSATLFLPAEQGSGIAPGMAVQLSPSSVNAAVYGTATGRVSSVGQTPLTLGAIQDIAANDIVADRLAGSGPLIAVGVDLDHDSGTPTGLKWTRHAGPSTPLQPGVLVNAEISQRSQSPLAMAFGG